MTEVHPHLELEYEEINANIRSLADVRFKLLALIPALGGAAVFVLARAGLQAGTTPDSSHLGILVVLLVSMVGGLATLGVTLYDQRNSELYNGLIHRAKHLEEQFNVPSTPGGLRVLTLGGQYRERPKRGRRVLFQAGHDVGLSLIYGPLLGAWAFPISYAAARLMGIANEHAVAGSVALAGLAAACFISWLLVLDGRDRELYRAAGARDALDKIPDNN